MMILVRRLIMLFTGFIISFCIPSIRIYKTHMLLDRYTFDQELLQLDDDYLKNNLCHCKVIFNTILTIPILYKQSIFFLGQISSQKVRVPHK